MRVENETSELETVRLLYEEYEKGRIRQGIQAKRPSGFMKGVSKAIKMIEQIEEEGGNKRMTTIEMIKKLTENPDKEFRTNCGTVVMDKEGSIIWKASRHNFSLHYLNLRNQWEEVKKPIGFMAATESNKKIKVEHPILDVYDDKYSDHRFKKYRTLTCLLQDLGGYFSNEDVKNIILNGKWYIE